MKSHAPSRAEVEMLCREQDDDERRHAEVLAALAGLAGGLRGLARRAAVRT